MAYLGVNENNIQGVFYFESLSVRDEVALNFQKPVYYFDGEKEKALKENGLVESDIQDGIVLIRQFRHKKTENEDSYLGLKGTPYDGIYHFKSRRVRDRIAKQFEGSYLSVDKQGILSEFNIHESEIKDGGFLMSNEVRTYLDKKSKKTENSKSSELDKGKVGTSKAEKKEKSANLLESMISALGNKYDMLEITMSTGEVWRVALKNFYYMGSEDILQNIAYIDSTNVPCIREDIVDKLVKDNSISILSRSKISYFDNFVMIKGCDDAYSPNVTNDKMGHPILMHQIDNILLNVNQIVSVKGFNEYSELNLIKITEQKHKLVYEYLTRGKKK